MQTNWVTSSGKRSQPSFFTRGWEEYQYLGGATGNRNKILGWVGWVVFVRWIVGYLELVWRWVKKVVEKRKRKCQYIVDIMISRSNSLNCSQTAIRNRNKMNENGELRQREKNGITDTGKRFPCFFFFCRQIRKSPKRTCTLNPTAVFNPNILNSRGWQVPLQLISVSNKRQHNECHTTTVIEFVSPFFQTLWIL